MGDFFRNHPTLQTNVENGTGRNLQFEIFKMKLQYFEEILQEITVIFKHVLI